MENETGIENMEIIPQSHLEKRLSLLQTRELFQNVKKFIKDSFWKNVIFSEHEGIQFDVDEPNTRVELFILDDPTNFVSLSYGLAGHEGDQILEQVNFQIVIQENNKTVIKRVAYNPETN